MAKKTVTISRKPSGTGEETAAAEGSNVLPAGLEDTSPKPGQAAAQTALSPEIPAGPGPVGRAFYNSVYCVSYGVVFSALMIGKLIPGSGLVGRAMREGADSACKDFDERNEAAEKSTLEPATA